MRNCAHLAALLAIGCGPARVIDEGEGSGAGDTFDAEPPAPVTATSGMQPNTTTQSPDGTSHAGSSDESDGDDPNGIPFIQRQDGGGSKWECGLAAQDCDAGEKCMPYSSGSPWWDAAACFPVHPDPVGLGEPCEYDGEPMSGHDNCGWGAVCWPAGGSWYCKGLCVDVAPWAPCEDPLAVAYEGCQSCFCVCERPCDPLAQDCHPGLMCVVTTNIATCVTDASGDAGAFGDPCEYLNACDPGLLCVGADFVPGCSGSQGCCTPHCDTQAPVCPAGLACDPYYSEPGNAPAGLEHLGRCVVGP